jgi:TrpR family trp operon transcriptional repressor
MNQVDEEWRRLLDFCVKLKTQKNFKEFFDLLFTMEEKEDLSKRMQVIRLLLKQEMPQREIAKNINVSIFMVTRGSNALKIATTGIKELFKQELN